MCRRSWILLAALFLAGPACARNREATSEAAPEAAAAGVVHVVVVNNRGGTITVEAIASSAAHRLGNVEEGMTRRFTLSAATLGAGRVEFRAWSTGSDPELLRGMPPGTAPGGEPVSTGLMFLRLGQVVEFRVAASQMGTTVSVQP